MADRGGVGRRSGLSRRTYGQREPVAAALDLLGDRWTLLIARELMMGPRRWSDLLVHLGGIGKNLLSDRLRDLEAAGLVTTSLLPWSSSRTRLYRLTDAAAPLERVVLELARFGAPRLHASGEERPEWAVLALVASLDREVDVVLHVGADGSWFTIRVSDGVVHLSRGQHAAAETVIEGTTEDVFAEASRRLAERAA